MLSFKSDITHAITHAIQRLQDNRHVACGLAKRGQIRIQERSVCHGVSLVFVDPQLRAELQGV